MKKSPPERNRDAEQALRASLSGLGMDPGNQRTKLLMLILDAEGMGVTHEAAARVLYNEDFNERSCPEGTYIEELKKTHRRRIDNIIQELKVCLGPVRLLIGYGVNITTVGGRMCLEFTSCAFNERGSKCKPSFAWSALDHGSPSGEYSISVWVPVHGPDIQVGYRVNREQWSPPGRQAEVANYKKFRDQRWVEVSKEQEKNTGEKMTGKKKRRWGVSSHALRSDGTGGLMLELCLRPVAFEDIVATTWTLKEGCVIPDMDKTVYEWLSGHQVPGQFSHFVPAANPFMIQVNAVTSDEKFLVRWGGRRWEPAVLGFANADLDVCRNDLATPDFLETFFRKAYERLGQTLHPGRVRWVGLSFGLIEGKVSLLGQITVEQSSVRIIDIARDREKWTAANEKEIPALGEIRAFDFTVEGVSGFLNENRKPSDGSAGRSRISNQFEVLLVLALSARFPKCVKIKSWAAVCE